MNELGTFAGIGVGPGPSGLITLAAWEALQQSAVIFCPRARHVQESIARQCLAGLDIPSERFREIVYNQDSEENGSGGRYIELAAEIARKLQASKNAAYLTIGDSFTYSTYAYVLAALLKILPGLRYRTFPGITSYAAIASAVGWPLGQGKERTL